MISKKGMDGTGKVLYCGFCLKVLNSWNLIMATFNVIKVAGYKVVE